MAEMTTYERALQIYQVLIAAAHTRQTLDWACTTPGAVAFAAENENRAFIERIIGRTPEVMIENLVKLCEYALERADEARQLMVHLKRP